MPNTNIGDIVGDVVSGVGSYFGAKETSTIMRRSERAARQQEWKMYKQGREDIAPWREEGEKWLKGLSGRLLWGPGEFKPEEDPGYEFGFERFVRDPYMKSQELKGKRGSGSGEMMKGLTEYAQQYAGTQYDKFLDRYYRKIQPAQFMAQMGQAAAAGQASMAQQTGGRLSDIAYKSGMERADLTSQQWAAGTGLVQSGIESAADIYSAYKNKIGSKGTGSIDYSEAQNTATDYDRGW